jgi:hypothetical protein
MIDRGSLTRSYKIAYNKFRLFSDDAELRIGSALDNGDEDAGGEGFTPRRPCRDLALEDGQV